MNKVLVLGGSRLQVPLIKRLVSRKIYVILADKDVYCEGKKSVDKFYQVSTLDYDSILFIARIEKVDAVMTTATDKPIRVIARVAKKLGLVSIPYDVALVSTNKALTSKRFKKHQVPSPDYRIINKRTFEMLKDTFSYPAIMKPLELSGSRGVYYIKDFDEVEDALRYSTRIASSENVIVQEYVPGAEVSVECFIVDNICHFIQITDKITSGPPHFVEIGHSQPTALDLRTKQEIEKVTKQALNALCIEEGPAHVEIKIDDEKLSVIEVGPRLGGDFITSHLTDYSTNVSMVDLLIDYYLDKIIDIGNIKNQGYSTIIFITNPNIKESVKLLLDELNSLPNTYCEVELYNNDSVRSVQSSSDRYGHVFCRSRTNKDLRNDVMKIYCKYAKKRVSQ